MLLYEEPYELQVNGSTGSQRGMAERSIGHPGGVSWCDGDPASVSEGVSYRKDEKR